MSDTYAKLFSTVLDSTVWVGTEPHIKLLWIVMLAKKDAGGRVMASVPGLAKLAEITIQQAEEALAVFMAPDPYSRTTAHEGRRIEAIDGGWVVLNHERYRDKQGLEERRRRDRERKRRQRERQAVSRDRHVMSLHTDTDADQSCSSSLRSEERVNGKPLTRVPYKEISELWTAKTGRRLSDTSDWTKARKQAVRRLWDEKHLGPDLENWEAYFGYVWSSPFLRGDNDRGWAADFDWALKPANLMKVDEGKYHAKV